MTDTVPGAGAASGSLLDWFTQLVSDDGARARFAADPEGFLAENGLSDLDPADVHHVLPLVADTVAARLDTTFDASVPAPDPQPLDGETALQAIARQVSYVSEQVRPPGDGTDPDWTESLLDDLAGAPDGLEGFGHPIVPLGDVPPGFDDHDPVSGLTPEHDLDDHGGHDPDGNDPRGDEPHTPDPTDPVDSAVSTDLDLFDFGAASAPAPVPAPEAPVGGTPEPHGAHLGLVDDHDLDGDDAGALDDDAFDHDHLGGRGAGHFLDGDDGDHPAGPDAHLPDAHLPDAGA